MLISTVFDVGCQPILHYHHLPWHPLHGVHSLGYCEYKVEYAKQTHTNRSPCKEKGAAYTCSSPWLVCLSAHLDGIFQSSRSHIRIQSLCETFFVALQYFSIRKSCECIHECTHRVIGREASPFLSIHSIRVHCLHQSISMSCTTPQRLHDTVFRKLPVTGGSFRVLWRWCGLLKPLPNDYEFGEKRRGIHDGLS